MKSFSLDAQAVDLSGIGALDPVVLVTLDFRIGDAQGRQTGSGFLLNTWSDALVTAAHVLAIPQNAVPTALTITLFGAAGSVDAAARSWAYLDETAGTSDVGVVRFPMNRPTQDLGMHTGLLPPAGVAATVSGFVSGAKQVINVTVTHNLGAGLLAYAPPDAGANGMSGGPVRTATAVVGIHLGRIPGMNANGAVPVDDSVLTHLQNAAAAAEAK